ncbi:MAG: hypothetical protein F6K50_28555 [Moorea sp. SIO3I7]|uniref:hypothetical protein n=1 Tax=unclassified Moorena TaxID=2683338 RepID=UPI0013BFD78D|nr:MULTISPECIES: hypothetical protein [unclassified Moorena]NEN99293.1 hypothetical protein [Moorena sp. SIO3I7]NEO07843.1 hypothetical protein [Moorena sp. SIO3I8]NEO22009.1 hypothetical protein [Moorena sp. SIO4A5]NEQ60865.1 hypothetical protein [Moorena sp. SIO4A1]
MISVTDHLELSDRILARAISTGQTHLKIWDDAPWLHHPISYELGRSSGRDRE